MTMLSQISICFPHCTDEVMCFSNDVFQTCIYYVVICKSHYVDRKEMHKRCYWLYNSFLSLHNFSVNDY